MFKSAARKHGHKQQARPSEPRMGLDLYLCKRTNNTEVDVFIKSNIISFKDAQRKKQIQAMTI